MTCKCRADWRTPASQQVWTTVSTQPLCMCTKVSSWPLRGTHIFKQHPGNRSLVPAGLLQQPEDMLDQARRLHTRVSMSDLRGTKASAAAAGSWICTARPDSSSHCPESHKALARQHLKSTSSSKALSMDTGVWMHCASPCPPAQPSALHDSHLCRENQLQAALCPAKAQKSVNCSSPQWHALLQKPCLCIAIRCWLTFGRADSSQTSWHRRTPGKCFRKTCSRAGPALTGLGLPDSLLDSILLQAWQLCLTCCAPGSDSHCNMISCPACTAHKVCSAIRLTSA